MATLHTRIKQVVDWSAALWAGLISGIAFLLLTIWLTHSYVGSAWIVPRLLASVLLGVSVLPPPASYSTSVLLAALAVHIPLSLAFACLIAYVLHRWGLMVGIVGGGLFGLALYGINFYTLAAWFPQFLLIKSTLMALSHVAFGALAGGIYELLEIEELVAVAEE